MFLFLMFVIVLLISLAANVVLVMGGLRASNKLEKYEEFIGRMRDNVIDTINNMRRIDASGVFEKDDEVGVVFTALVHQVDSLTNFLEKE
jgi:hypothetical protein